MTKPAVKERDPDLLGDAPLAAPPAAKLPATRSPPRQKPGTLSKMEAPGEASENFLAVIIRAASDPLTDVGKVRELLAMKKQLEDERKAQEFALALHTAQGLMPKIVKDGENPTTHSKFAKLESISTKIDPIAREHGFTHSYGTADSPIADHYRIVCDLTHTNGHSRRYFVDLPADGGGMKGTQNKSGVQAVGSTIAYGRRYIKVLIWDLVIVGEDKNGNRAKNAAPDKVVGKINAKQAASLTTALDVAEVDKVEFCKVYKIDSPADLPADLYDHALKDIATVREERSQKKTA